MTVAQLMESLKDMPSDALVTCVADGAARELPDVAYVSQSGAVVLASHGDVVYYTQDRPVGAPAIGEQRYWYVP